MARSYCARVLRRRWRTHGSRIASRQRFLCSPEQLEDRRLLSLASGDFGQPTPAWFEAVEFPYGPLTVEQSVVALASSSNTLPEDGASLVRDRWIVQLREESLAGIDTLDDVARQLSTSDSRFAVLRGLGTPGQVLVCALNGTADQATAALQANPNVAFVESDRTVQASTVPNDIRFVDEWGLANTGQFGGVAGVDIDATQAWDVTTGSMKVVVGVIDSGIDPTHVDLYQNIWLNQGEIPSALRSQLADVDGDQLITFRDLNDATNSGLASDVSQNGIIDALDLFDDPRWGDGIDEDRNGFPDDLFGWDFRNHTPFARDEYGHGTHVAGTIGATGNNGIGGAGVNWAVSLMSLKFLGANNEGTLADAVAAINYATMMRTEVNEPTNVRVLNASWGQAGDSPALESAIEAAGAAYILLVAAAGNGNVLGQGMDIDREPFYPASYDLPNLISVAAIGQYGELAGFSNYGVTSVDLAAPGIGILSTKPGNAYALQNGTSMAAPHVTGAAALAWSQVTDATVAEVREALLQNADVAPELTGKVATGGRVDAYQTVTATAFAPRAEVISMPDISTASSAPQRITVRYRSNTPLDVTSVGDGDLVAVRTWGSGNTLNATLVPDSLSVISATECTVEYEFVAPGGDWDVSDYGDFEVRLVAGQVFNHAGLASPARNFGAFHVQIIDANVFYVNGYLDTVDANPGDGLAADASGLTTLRAAVMEANTLAGAQAIVLQAGTYTLTIPGRTENESLTGDIDVSGEVTILGAGAARTTLDAASLDNMIEVPATGILQLTGVTIRNGSAVQWDCGGALRNFGTATVDDSQLTGNTGWYGGAIYNEGHLVVAHSSISGNSAESGGGGIRNYYGEMWLDCVSVTSNSAQYGGGGGIQFEGGTASITNSTISDNVVKSNFHGGSGGGIYNYGATVSLTNTTISGNYFASDYGGYGGNGAAVYNVGTMDFLNCTITANTSYQMAGISSVSGTTRVKNTFLAGNLAVQNPDMFGYVTSLGHNIVSSIQGSWDVSPFTAEGDQILPNAADFLGPLQDNGGPTWTHALLPGSAALDSGTNDGAPGTDQRGIARPCDADQDLIATVDIGAYERYHVEIHGRRFHDVNGNYRRDPGELGLGGLKIYLDNNDNGTLDPDEPTAITRYDDPATEDVNEAGTYSFLGLVPDAYRVAEVPQAGWIQMVIGPTGPSRLNVAVDGTQANGGVTMDLAMSPDGQYVVFTCSATNLTPEAAEGLYLVDRQANTIEFVQPGRVGWLTFGHDGRSIVFAYGGGDVYLYDRITKTTERVSMTMDGGPGIGSESLTIGVGRVVSADGRFVTFMSGFSNLVPNDTNGLIDTFVYDRHEGSMERVNIADDGTQANLSGANYPTISADGRYVVFGSPATNLVPGPDTNGSEGDVYVYDRLTKHIRRVNVSAEGTQADLGAAVFSISADGRLVLFLSPATNLVPGSPAGNNMYICDWQTREIDYITMPLVNGVPAPFNDVRGISGDFRCIMFSVTVEGREQLALYDRLTEGYELLVHGYDGNPANGGLADMSDDGGDVVFFSDSTNLVVGDTNFASDVFHLTSSMMSHRRAQTVTLGAGQVAGDVDFGDQPLRGEIRGNLFDDQDKDGARDLGEAALAGWTVYLDADQDGRLDVDEVSTQTNADGRYEFLGVAPLRSHTVAEVARDGWEQTWPGRAGNYAYTMYVDAGAVFAGRDFGNAYVGTLGQSMNGVIQGRVFEDRDSDGQQDPGEAGTADQIVFLDMNDNGTREFNEPRKVTDASGNYAFTDLGPASYTARLLTTEDQQQLSPLGNQLASEHYATGASSNPKFLAPGDFDQDGRQDIAVVNQDTNSLLILRNNGSSFVPGALIDVGFAPSSAVVYDLDGVHGPDLIVSNLYSSTATILLNNGTGGFTGATELYVGSLPASLTLGDLNHDGRADLVVANQNAYSPYFPDNNQVSVLFGTASGWFSGVTAYSAGSNPSSVATAHVNTDDYLDLVVANGDSDSVSVLINQGNGTFLPAVHYAVGAAPSCIVAEDLSGDGLADIAVTNALGNTISVLINHGDGTFQTAQSAAAGTGPVAVSAVDLEGDGDRDLVVANRTNLHLAVLRNRGNGTFEPPESYGVGDFPTDLSFAVTAADFNGDGVPDVTVANGQADNISVLRNSLVPGAQRMAIVNGTEVIAGVNFTVQSVQTPLQVASFTSSPSGFSVEFNRPLDPDTLNLYGSAGAADVTVVGAQAGTVRGSLLVQDNRITWLATGGVLAPDQYTVTLRSAADAFRDHESGDLLDGNRDRVPGGDYVTSMVVPTRAANTVVVSIPDFARGYGQSVNLPASDLAAGLPLQLSNGLGVSGLDLRLHYDPTLLEIQGFTLASAVQAAGASALLTVPTPGTVILTISSPDSLATASGPLTVGSFTASVPADAPYAAKQLLDISDLFVFDDTIDLNELPSAADDALHVAAYFGDTNGSGTYNAPDTALVQRMIGELTTGLNAYRLIDPKVLADITLNGLLQANDTTSIQRVIGQVSVPNVPELPDGLPVPPAGGPDPFVYIPQDLAGAPGDTLSVPVKMNVTESAGITLGGFDLTMEFDPTRFSVNSAQVGSLLTGAGFAGLLNQPAPGKLIYTASSATGMSLLPAGTQGDLVTLSLTVLADAASGPTVINVLGNYGRTTTALFSAELEDLSLVPAPTNAANDTCDGLVTITVPASVMGRHIFYNNSKWDGHGTNGDPAANAFDDLAIAPDKQPLFNGKTATFANYTSYSRGINGIMIDIANLAQPTGLTAADFEFRTGNSNNPATWAILGVAPTVINVREGAGVDGSDRVTILFTDGAVKKTWLQVKVKATDATGLATPDVHYWGNAIGETGNLTTNAFVDVSDSRGVRSNPHPSTLNPAPVDDRFDFNRDKLVNVTDDAFVRANPTNALTALKLINLSGVGGAAEGEGEVVGWWLLVVGGGERGERGKRKPSLEAIDLALTELLAEWDPFSKAIGDQR